MVTSQFVKQNNDGRRIAFVEEKESRNNDKKQKLFTDIMYCRDFKALFVEAIMMSCASHAFVLPIFI